VNGEFDQPKTDPPLIIGQAPARGNNGKLPFAGKSGSQLAKMAGVGNSGDDLPGHFLLVNLNAKYPGKNKKGDQFDKVEGVETAEKLKAELLKFSPSLILLMGRKVEKCWGFKRPNPYLQWIEWEHHRVAIFPHPSGVNMWYNDPLNRTKATLFLRRCLERG
jgi:uracil-DNA glycosylase